MASVINNVFSQNFSQIWSYLLDVNVRTTLDFFKSYNNEINYLIDSTGNHL